MEKWIENYNAKTVYLNLVANILKIMAMNRNATK